MSLENPFCKYVVEWLLFTKNCKAHAQDFLFPPYKRWLGWRFGHGNDKVEDRLYHLSVQRFDQILQRLDPTLTSAMFRYGHTEQLLYQGYTPSDLKDIGDWESTRMPEIYARRKGITPATEKYASELESKLT